MPGRRLEGRLPGGLCLNAISETNLQEFRRSFEAKRCRIWQRKDKLRKDMVSVASRPHDAHVP